MRRLILVLLVGLAACGAPTAPEATLVRDHFACTLTSANGALVETCR